MVDQTGTAVPDARQLVKHFLYVAGYGIRQLVLHVARVQPLRADLARHAIYFYETECPGQ